MLGLRPDVRLPLQPRVVTLSLTAKRGAGISPAPLCSFAPFSHGKGPPDVLIGSRVGPRRGVERTILLGTSVLVRIPLGRMRQVPRKLRGTLGPRTRVNGRSTLTFTGVTRVGGVSLIALLVQQRAPLDVRRAAVEGVQGVGSS